MRHIVAAMRTHGVRRVLGVAGGGILDSVHGGLRHDQPTFPAIFKQVSDRHTAAWHAMRDGDLDWTMVCTGTSCRASAPGSIAGAKITSPKARTASRWRMSRTSWWEEMTANRHLRTRVGLGY